MEYGPRVIGVLLTGGDDDGSAGLKAIQERGGIVVVQAPADSEHPEMPQSALNVVAPDFTLPVNQIAPLLASLVSGAIQPDRRSAMSEPADKSFGARLPHSPVPNAAARYGDWKMA